MMTYFQSILLGIVQGLSEFLPISSSAHLVITPWAFGFADPGLAFDVALHLGTLLAILSYFWKDWLEIVNGSYRALAHSKTKSPQDSQHLKLLVYIVIATVPGAAAGLILNDLAEHTLRHPLLIAVMMMVLGTLLWIADRKRKTGDDLERISFKQAFLVGCFQACALIPGVSRSGVTITSGLFLGLSRVTAARFSFLLATPITIGALVFKLDDILREGVNGQAIAGIFASALVGFLSIKYLLRYVQNRDYRIFVYYRFLFAFLVFIRFFYFSNF